MIDPAKLSTFFAAPDAATIVDAFAGMEQGPQRAALVSYIATLAGMSLPAPVVLDEVAQAPKEAPKALEGPTNPLLAPDAPFVSSSVDGRIVERKLRGTTVEQIAVDEGVEVDHVMAVLKEARSNGVDVGSLWRSGRGGAKAKPKGAPNPPKDAKLSTKLDSRSQKPRVYTKEPRPPLPPALNEEIKAESIRLRQIGYGPSAIAVHIGIDRATVSNAIFYAKHNQEMEFPDPNPDLPPLPSDVMKEKIDKAISLALAAKAAAALNAKAAEAKAETPAPQPQAA